MNGREVMVAYYAALCAQVCSLEAKYDACCGWPANRELQREAYITAKQIDALKAEIEIAKMNLEKQ